MQMVVLVVTLVMVVVVRVNLHARARPVHWFCANAVVMVHIVTITIGTSRKEGGDIGMGATKRRRCSNFSCEKVAWQANKIQRANGNYNTHTTFCALAAPSLPAVVPVLSLAAAFITPEVALGMITSN